MGLVGGSGCDTVEFVEGEGALVRIGNVVCMSNCVKLTGVSKGCVVVVEPHEAAASFASIFRDEDVRIVQVGGGERDGFWDS